MKADFEKIGELAEIDDLIYQNTDFFSYDIETINQINRKLLFDAYKLHKSSNEDYKNYSARCRSVLASPQEGALFNEIPLIPSTMFKLTDVLSVDKSEIIKVCNSSGTKGSISNVFRDEDTLQRFIGGMQNVIDSLLCLDDVFCVNLGPSTEEAKDLWISYVMSLIDLIFPTENFVVNGEFYPENVLKYIIENKDVYENVVIVGAPVMFLELMDYFKEKNVEINDSENIICITAGGWKRMKGKAIDQDELFSKLSEYFQGLKRENFRDILNMVELNSIFCECEFGVKHVPIWVEVQVLDPFDLKQVENGKEGLLAYWDASATSYPAFVLTDDIGRIVLDGECKCGRCGKGVQLIRRVESKESRGCALKIDKKISKGANKK